MSFSKLCSLQWSPLMKTNISNISGTIQIYTVRLLWSDFRRQDQGSEIQYNTTILTAIIIFGTFPSFAKT